MSRAEEKRFRSGLARARATAKWSALPWRHAPGKVDLPERCLPALREWIFDKIWRGCQTTRRGHTWPTSSLATCLRRCLAPPSGVLRRAATFPTPLAPESRELVHGKIRRPLQGADLRKPVHHHHEPYRQGRSLLHSSRPGSVPQSHGERGGASPDVPGQLLVPRQPHATVHSGGNAVPPFLAYQIAQSLWNILDHHDRTEERPRRHQSVPPGRKRAQRTRNCPVSRCSGHDSAR